MARRTAASRVKSIFHSKHFHVTVISAWCPHKRLQKGGQQNSVLYFLLTLRGSQGLENKMRLVIPIDQVTYFLYLLALVYQW